MLSSSSDSTQFLKHDKSRSMSDLIKGKSRGLPRVLKYFNKITTSVFGNGIDSHGGSSCRGG